MHESRIFISAAPVWSDDEEKVVSADSSRASSDSTTSTSSDESHFSPVFPPELSPHMPSAPSQSASCAWPDPDAHDADSAPACRICFDGSSEGELIVPCLCSGSSLWIHRRCLDEWRAVNVGLPAFSECSTCQFKFEYERPLVAPSTFHTVKCRLLVVRDVLGLLLLSQVWLIVLAAFIGGFDDGAGHHLRRRFPHISPHPLYYLFSVLISLALLGVFGLLASWLGWEERLVGPRTDRMGDGCNCLCDGCNTSAGNANCGSGCSGGSSDDGCGTICFVIGMIVLLVLATIGLVYGIVYGSVLIERIVSRHMKKGWNWPVVERYPVVDWQHRQSELRMKQEAMERAFVFVADV